MQHHQCLHDEYVRIHREAKRLAGGLNDLAQRAAVYHHLFEHSGGNHVFPLIAAHGALWASNYFQKAIQLGTTLSFANLFRPEKRRRDLTQLAQFIDAFRDINRRVCIDTYTTYHFSDRFGGVPDAEDLVPAPLLSNLSACHQARRSGRTLTDHQRRELFRAFFLNEQTTIVAPTIDSAVENFEWRLMKRLSLRPRISFAYLRKPFWFSNFADTDERIQRGLEAFDEAIAVGLDVTETALQNYAVMPPAFFSDSRTHFESIKTAVAMA